MELALASGRCGLLAPRPLGARRAPRARGPMVRSVLEINKPPASTANGAGKPDLAGEVANELKYRLAAKADTDKLYQSCKGVCGRAPRLPTTHWQQHSAAAAAAACTPTPLLPALPCPQWPGACTTAWWMRSTRPRSTGSELAGVGEGSGLAPRRLLLERAHRRVVLMQVCNACMHPCMWVPV